MMRLVLLLVFLSHIPWELQAAYGIHDIGREPDNILYASNGRIRGFSNTRDKDIILAGIIPIHKPEGLTCTNELFINDTFGYVEAFLYSIDAINNDANLLPGITLGYDIRDSCIAESTAVEETVDLVLLSNSERCQVSSSLDLYDDIDAEHNETSNTPITGVIGSFASFVSIPIANFLRLFNVLQVSPFSTSPLLSNREHYSYFYRAVPSDDQQIQAIIDLLLRFGWKYVSAIHSNDLYGEPGIDRFIELADRNDICTDLNIGISTTDTEAKFQNNIARIYNSTANVIVCFASYDVVVDLFDRILSEGAQRKFLWIASDAWVELITDQPKYEPIIAGLWGIIPRTNPDPDFYAYLSQLTLANNNRNPWYGEFYRQFYNCIDASCLNNATETITAHPDHRNPYIASFMIDAVYTFAHVIHSFLHDRCAKPIVWNSTARTCVGQTDVPSGSILREYVANTSFKSPTGNDVIIDRETGSTIGVYRILNHQWNNDTGKYQLVTVGEWKGTEYIGTSKLIINQSMPLQFGTTQDGRPRNSLVKSYCRQCPLGSIWVSVVSSCCGTCSACVGMQYTPYSNQSLCMNCTEGMWGNDPIRGSNSCLPISTKYLNASDAWGIFLIILAFFGMGAVIFVSIVLIIYWNTPIVKASGREQMVLLLIGIALCFLSVIFFLIRPSIPICLLQRISLWLFLSLILCSLFVKLVRITRIFLRKQTSPLRPMFIGPISQIIFTFLLVGVQMILVIISLVIVYPEPENIFELNPQNTNDHPVYLIRCKSPHIALITLQMLYFSVLLIVSNALAMVTIRFPANFKEVVYVAFSTFCIGIIWIAFVSTYFATSYEFQAAIVSFAIQMSAFAVLVCMFGPRVFIMIFMPQKNVTEAKLVKSSTNIRTALAASIRHKTRESTTNNGPMAALGTGP